MNSYAKKYQQVRRELRRVTRPLGPRLVKPRPVFDAALTCWEQSSAVHSSYKQRHGRLFRHVRELSPIQPQVKASLNETLLDLCLGLNALLAK